MISWTRFFKKENGILYLGIHNSGVYCILNSSRNKEFVYAYAFVNHSTHYGENELEGFYFSVTEFEGNTGEATELLDKYIQDNLNEDYLNEDPFPIIIARSKEGEFTP